MVDEGRHAPHGVVLVIVVVVFFTAPILLGDQAQPISEAIARILSPAALLLLPVVLLIVIRFLSSDRTTTLSDIFFTGEPDSIHRVGGSPVGVALLLLLLFFLLYSRVSLFGSIDDDSGD